MYDENKAHYVVATCIILKGGKYLIAKRSANEKAFPNKWTVPGGKLEVNDYSKRKEDTSAGQWHNVCETLLRREEMEEVGLNIKNIGYITSLAFIRPDKIPALVLSFYADHDDGDVKLCKDLTEYKWVTLDEAKEYDLIDGIYEEIEMLDNYLKGKELGEWRKK